MNQNQGNRNFHVFYQLLSNAFSNEMRQQLLLTKSANQYKFLNQGNVAIDKDIDDAADGLLTSVSSLEIVQIYALLLMSFPLFPFLPKEGADQL